MALPVCPSTSTKYGYQQIHNLDTALAQLERIGFGPGTDAYDALWRQRGEVLGHIGYKTPKVDTWIGGFWMGSPQRLRAWFDPEAGWFAEVRDSPKGPPRYKMVSFEDASAIIKKEVAPELKDRLFAPDDYLGE